MRHFMDHVQNAFYDASGWSRDSCYTSLNAVSDDLLAFPTPRGLRLSLSSLATAHLATSYQLGSVGIVEGSISYLFSSVPLAAHLSPSSARVRLPALIRAYKPLSELPLRGGRAPAATASSPPPSPSSSSPSPPFPPSPCPPPSAPQASLPHNLPRHPTLLYGRLYLPKSMLEALLVARVASAVQLQLSAVSSPGLRNGGTVLGLAQFDVGRWALEGLASSDGGLLGLRGAYNFGGDLDDPQGQESPGRGNGNHGNGDAVAGAAPPGPERDRERIYGRFTAGGEVYYGTLNKSGGISVGARFATLPAHKGTPLVATMTLNPLVGSITATYSVVAGRQCSLATRLDFNVYSYDSHWSVGMELWRRGVGKGTEDDQGGLVAAAAAAAAAAAGPPRPAAEPVETNRPAEGERPEGGPPMRSFRAKLEWRLDEARENPEATSRLSSSKTAPGAMAATPTTPVSEVPKTSHEGGAEGGEEEFAGAIKVRLDETMKVGVLWEGRVKSLLYSVGSGIDLRRLDQPFRTLGVEIQFSS